MIGKIRIYITVILSVFAFSMPMLIPVAASAATACTEIQSEVNSGVNDATGGQTTCGSGSTIGGGIKSAASTVVNILSVVVGIVAVIMIIYGGFRYISSGGESGSVQSAKNTLLFAVVGLVIVALAQVLVHWVLNTSNQLVGSSGFIRF